MSSRVVGVLGSSRCTASWYAADLRDQIVMIVGETGTGKELVSRTFGHACPIAGAHP